MYRHGPTQYHQCMSDPISRPWPPPPDLPSIQELVRTADVEGFIAAHGSQQDEYQPEEDELFHAIHGLPTADLLVANLLPPLERIWTHSFNLDEEALARRRPALLSLAKEIERFFGPESQPRTRSEILADTQPIDPAQ